MRRKQIILLGVTVLLIAAYGGANIYASSIAKEKIDRAIAKVASYADVDYRDISADLVGHVVHISDVTISPVDYNKKIKINDIAIYDFDEESDPPSFFRVSLNGVEVDVNNLGVEGQEFIKKLRYDNNIFVNLDIEYNYDQERKELILDKFRIGADGVGYFDTSFRLGNIDLNSERAMMSLLNAPAILLYNARIHYHDDSLIERALNASAREQNKDVEQIKEHLFEDIDKASAEAKDELSRGTLKELKEFIDDPTDLTISITPERPIPLGRVLRSKDSREVIDLLKLSIRS